MANQRQKTRGRIVVREGGDAAVWQWGGETGRSGARATVLPPLLAASGKRDHRLAERTTTTPPSTTTAMLPCVGQCFGARGRSALLICLVLALSTLRDSRLRRSSPNASLSWCRASMSLCLVPMLTGCRTMPFMGPRGAHCTASTSTAGRLRDGYFGQI